MSENKLYRVDALDVEGEFISGVWVEKVEAAPYKWVVIVSDQLELHQRTVEALASHFGREDTILLQIPEGTQFVRLTEATEDELPHDSP